MTYKIRLVSYKAYGQRDTLMGNKINQMVEYIKIHEVSLMQDLEKIDYVNEHHFYRVKEAEIYNTRHLLSVATDILNEDVQGKGY
jgi:hypothetical protein